MTDQKLRETFGLLCPELDERKLNLLINKVEASNAAAVRDTRIDCYNALHDGIVEVTADVNGGTYTVKQKAAHRILYGELADIPEGGK